jgi:hypothetical protein
MICLQGASRKAFLYFLLLRKCIVLIGSGLLPFAYSVLDTNIPGLESGK